MVCVNVYSIDAKGKDVGVKFVVVADADAGAPAFVLWELVGSAPVELGISSVPSVSSSL